MVRLDAQPVEHREVEIGQRVVVYRVENEVLTMLEATTGKEGREVGRCVGVAVTEIGAVKHHGTIQQGFAFLGHRLQADKKVRELFQLRDIQSFQLRKYKPY